MKKRLCYIILSILFPLALAAQNVAAITIDGPINAATAGFIHESIARARNDNAVCLLIRLNTPGGMLSATRKIVSDLLQAPLPVIVYVTPGGAHAGSAGVFITLAAHIAAMSPGTNIGAAHPVNLQGGLDSIMSAKATNDAAAFIRSVAQKRNRDLHWAEEAVRNSISITANEAREKNVVDLVAFSDRDLLDQLEGKTVDLNGVPVILHTRGRPVQNYEMGFVEKLLNVISDPNIAYILLLIGFFGLLFELYNPGAILPGIVGVISLVLAFYAFQSLPVNYAGLALIIFSVILFVLELKIVSHGMLAIGGIVSLLMGSLMLLGQGPSLEYARINRLLIVSATAVTALFFLFVLGLGVKAQRRKVVTGKEGLVGQTGITVEELSPSGTVRVQGESWNAVSLAGPIGKGVVVEVKEIREMRLYVIPA